MFVGQTIRWCVVDGSGRLLASLLTRERARKWIAGSTRSDLHLCRLVIV